MSIQVEIGEGILVYAPKMNKIVAEWGVYALPRMWKDREGRLIVRLNGEADTGDLDRKQKAPNLYFISYDDGDTWQPLENGEQICDISVMTGINPPYMTRSNGDKIAVKYRKDAQPIKDIAYGKAFVMPCGAERIQTYRYGDIPAECKGMLLERTPKDSTELREYEIDFDFPEREVLVPAYGCLSDGKTYVPIEKYVQPCFYKNNYFSGITELDDGTLAALSYGQNPKVEDHYCGEVYLVVSEDDGITWKKRAVVAGSVDKVPYGYGGDGGEVSLTRACNGDLLCVMRMDMSVNPEKGEPIFDAMLVRSQDNGFTWSEPMIVADSSVTPHVVALKDDVVLLVYGRPGVHFKYSADNGRTWSDSYSIIGKTLEQERAAGKSDYDSKYGDTVSYSNTCVEKITEDTVIILYTDVKYDDGSGQLTKATLVKKISIKKL